MCPWTVGVKNPRKMSGSHVLWHKNHNLGTRGRGKRIVGSFLSYTVKAVSKPNPNRRKITQQGIRD